MIGKYTTISSNVTKEPCIFSAALVRVRSAEFVYITERPRTRNTTEEITSQNISGKTSDWSKSNFRFSTAYKTSSLVRSQEDRLTYYTLSC